MDPKKTAVLLSRKLTLYTVVLVPPGGKLKNFHLFYHFSASRGIKSKTVQAAEIRIKFCIFSGQIHVSPCPEHKLSILRHQMKMAVFFGSIWARLAPWCHPLLNSSLFPFETHYFHAAPVFTLCERDHAENMMPENASNAVITR